MYLVLNNQKSHEMSHTAVTNRKSKKDRKAPIRIATGSFNFENGDTYEGEFVIDSKSNTIFRQGTGVYKTHLGHIYEGKWLNDKLVIRTKIFFPTNCSFEGVLNDEPTYMNGTYTFPDRSEITGDFKKLFNEVKNAATFTDPNKKLWDTHYKNGYVHLLFPWNWMQSDLKSDEETCDER